jgi:hypothetical protein
MPGPKRARRFLIEPLEDASGFGNVEHIQCGKARAATAGGLAEQLGVSQGTVQRWRSEGVPLWAADRAAIRLGVHPHSLWPDFHHEHLDQEEHHESSDSVATVGATVRRAAVPAR